MPKPNTASRISGAISMIAGKSALVAFSPAPAVLIPAWRRVSRVSFNRQAPGRLYGCLRERSSRFGPRSTVWRSGMHPVVNAFARPEICARGDARSRLTIRAAGRTSSRISSASPQG